MNPRTSTRTQSFFGTLEQCVQQYGGESRFKVSAPLTFFNGARLETHRRAEANDGSVVIIEHQHQPTTCEVYLQAAAMRPQSTRVPNLPQANCA